MLSTTIRYLTKTLIRLLNIVFIGLTFGLLFITIFKPEWMVTFIEWMKNIIGTLGYWNYLIALGASMVEALPVIGTMVPGQNILLIVGGFFGHQHLLPVYIIAILGAILGDWIGYTLGAWKGKAFIEQYGNRFGIGKTEVRYIEKGIHHYGAWAIIIGKFHGMSRAFVPFIAGISKMKQWDFMLYNILGSTIWAVTIVSLGILFVAYYQVALDYIRYGILAILGGIILYITVFKREKFMKYLAEKQQELEEQEKKPE